MLGRGRLHAAAAVVTIVAMLLPAAVAAQSPVPAGGDAPILLPVVTNGSLNAADMEQPPAPDTPTPEDPVAEPPADVAPVADKGAPQEVPAGPDSPDARYFDSDGPMYVEDLLAAPVEAGAVAWNVIGDFSISNRLGVGINVPTYLGDFRRVTNGIAQVRVTNTYIGTSAGAALSAATNVGAAFFQVYGQVNNPSWSGLSLANYAMVRTDSALSGLVITTGGADPLVLGANNAQRLYIEPSGGIRIHSPTSRISGAKLNFGDGQYVYISEPTDDSMEVHSASEINLTTPRVEVNGSKPFMIIRYQDIDNNRNTGISASTYSCVVTGWAAYYDIEEDDAGPSAIWTYVYNNQWWVVANLRSHIDNDYPDVDVLCIRNELVDYIGIKSLWDPD